ncbi:MAG: spore coat associated protein CotJA [Desulfotomaculales bacterium]
MAPDKEKKPEAKYYPGYTGIPHLELATAYIPPQVLGRTFTPAEALQHGTLFPELYRPYP